MIDDERRDEFDRRGVVCLPGLLDTSAVAAGRDVIHQELERAGVMRAGRWGVAGKTDWVAHNALNKRLKRCAKADALLSLDSARVREVARDLLGGRAFRSMLDRPQILFTPPNADAWVLPHDVWHCDLPRLGPLGRPGVQTFAFLDTVAPGGGGTLVVAGSHRLLNDQGRVKSKDVKKSLRREPYFRDLMRASPDRHHFIDRPARVAGVEVQVVELTGEPGDVFLTDLRMLHNIAPNASRIPRLMLTQRYVLEEAMSGLVGATDP